MFKIIEKNKEFPNVTRIIAKDDNGLIIETDVHDLFFEFSDQFSFKIEKKTDNDNNKNNKNDLNHDYIMKGTVFKKNDRTYVSFNGLLMNFNNVINNNLNEGDEVYSYFDFV